MSGEIFSAYHEYVATTLAREINAYVAHSKKMSRYFRQRDVRENRQVYMRPDRCETEELRLKIIVFCAIYVEALANLYLSLKLTNDQFSAIDRIEIIEKWASVPSLFLPGYSIPRSRGLFCDLKTLVAQRNTIAHMKPKITAGSEIVHQGNLPKSIPIHAQIIRWADLPEALIKNVGVHDRSLEFMKFRALSHIEEYSRIRGKG